MLAEAGIRHALVGGLGANAYRNRRRTTEDIEFLVGDEAFERHEAGFVTMRVPVIECDGINVDQVPLPPTLAGLVDGLDRPTIVDGVPIAPVETIVLMKIAAGRTQDLADVEAIVGSGADRQSLASAVERSAPELSDALATLFANVDRQR